MKPTGIFVCHSKTGNDEFIDIEIIGKSNTSSELLKITKDEAIRIAFELLREVQRRKECAIK